MGRVLSARGYRLRAIQRKRGIQVAQNATVPPFVRSKNGALRSQRTGDKVFASKIMAHFQPLKMGWNANRLQYDTRRNSPASEEGPSSCNESRFFA